VAQRRFVNDFLFASVFNNALVLRGSKKKSEVAQRRFVNGCSFVCVFGDGLVLGYASANDVCAALALDLTIAAMSYARTNRGYTV